MAMARLLINKLARSQVTNRVMLIRPSCFKYNQETAGDNAFQAQLEGLTDSQAQEGALKEFKSLVTKLTEVNIAVKIFEDTVKVSPDAVFPNNWLSFHHDDNNVSRLVVYPMLSDKRKLERNLDIVKYWQETLSLSVVDYSHYEREGKYLEGTGSMVLDRVNKLAYACISPRTNVEVLDIFCKDFGYTSVPFRAKLSPKNDGELHDVYHTNVILSVCDGFAVICLEGIVDNVEREDVVQSLKKSNKEVVAITGKQVRG